MPAKRYKKIFRSGDSRVVGLPPDWLRAFNLDVGDIVEVIYDFAVIIKPPNLKLDPGLLIKELSTLSAETKGSAEKDGTEDEFH